MNNKIFALLGFVLFAGTIPLHSQPARRTPPTDLDLSASAMRPFIELFSLDRGTLLRYYVVDLDPARATRMKRFLTDWRERLNGIDFDALPQDGKVDYVVFRNYLDHELKKLEFDRPLGGWLSVCH